MAAFMSHCSTDDLRLRSQNATCREETIALINMLKASRDQVKQRICETRVLIDRARDLQARSTTKDLSKWPPERISRTPEVPGPRAEPNVSGHKTARSQAIRLLVTQISSGQFLTLNGAWTSHRNEATEFSSVRDLVHFALEHFLTFPLGVFCEFEDLREDFSIILCSADFLAARQWDWRIVDAWQAMHHDQTEAIPVQDNGTDHALASHFFLRHIHKFKPSRLGGGESGGVTIVSG